MMEAQAQQRGIVMTFPQFDQPSFVWGDQTRLKQIVINLLSNAIKYNQANGQVTVDCTAISSDRIRISFKDTGAGLSPEKIAQLFQPFNRLGQEAGSVAGTGIGLVVTKQLVELMGGVLGVGSKVGEGSVFWVELRSTPAPELKAITPELLEPKLAMRITDVPQKTLLYIEDNSANMKLVERLIDRRTDIKLLKAVDGTLGIALAQSSLPDVILMDINLPGISGIDALKALREDPATAHIPVVALSANAMSRDIEVGRQLGFFRYLTKPIVVEEFMTTLDLALDLAQKNAGGQAAPSKPKA
jgi:CheY-like chemotaxis protein